MARETTKRYYTKVNRGVGLMTPSSVRNEDFNTLQTCIEPLFGREASKGGMLKYLVSPGLLTNKLFS